MLRKLLVLATSGLLLAFCPAGATSKNPTANEDVFGHERLCVTVWPEKTRVQGDEVFGVKLRVVNSSEQVQCFRVMNCSWDEHWQCGNPRIAHVLWACTRNFPVTVELAPGEAYEQKLNMYVGAKGDSRTERFRMGFTPIGEKKTYRSNEVVIGVK